MFFFAAVDPAKGEMRRKRIYIDLIRDKKTEDRHAKRLIEHINNLPDSGKNPIRVISKNEGHEVVFTTTTCRGGL
ncbi:MAG: hypothetical protein ACP5D9_08980 [Mariniphaga sp.]